MSWCFFDDPVLFQVSAVDGAALKAGILFAGMADHAAGKLTLAGHDPGKAADRD